jgi:uncharacterized protein
MTICGARWMTEPVFADSSFYLAMVSAQDNWHRSASRLFEQLDDTEIVTSEYILLELGALLAKGHSRASYIDLVGRIRVDTMTEIVPATTALFDEGLELFGARPDKNWSIVDCISFVLMEKRKIARALTTDKHFTQAGFEALLSR